MFIDRYKLYRSSNANAISPLKTWLWRFDSLAMLCTRQCFLSNELFVQKSNDGLNLPQFVFLPSLPGVSEPILWIICYGLHHYIERITSIMEKSVLKRKNWGLLLVGQTYGSETISDVKLLWMLSGLKYVCEIAWRYPWGPWQMGYIYFNYIILYDKLWYYKYYIKNFLAWFIFSLTGRLTYLKY